MKRVLIVDDCDDFREIVVDLLEDAGYEAISTENPDAVVEMCRQEEFDAVICDLVMPLEADEEDEFPEDDEDGGSAFVGLHLIQRIREEHPDLPVILVSGKVEGGPLSVMQRMGASAVLTKPFGQEQLIRALTRLHVEVE